MSRLHKFTSLLAQTLVRSSRNGVIGQSACLTTHPKVYSTTTGTTATTANTKTKPGVSYSGFIREARQEDYDQVMDINHDVYGGRDYLPCLFPTFIRNKDIHCYVYETDGKVVGFEAAHVIDNGLTLVTRGARVREEFQGHGVMKQMRKYIVDKLASDHTIKCISMTTSNTTGLAMKPSVLKTNREIFRRDVHVFPYQVLQLKMPKASDFETFKVSQLSTKQLISLFQIEPIKSFLFPHDRIIINTVPFRLMEENFEHIQLENPFILISDKLMETSSDPKDGIMSMTTWFSCKAGICVDLEFYGQSTNFVEICNHVGQHLHHILNLAMAGHIMVPHSPSIGTDALLCVMARFNLIPFNSPFKTQYLFEEDIEQENV